MKQGVLPFQYEEEKKPTGMMALAGLPAYLDLARVAGLARSIGRHVRLREMVEADIAQLQLNGPSTRGRDGQLELVSSLGIRTRLTDIHAPSLQETPQ